MSIRRLSKDYKKYSNNFKYFMDTYMFTDNNSESLSFLIWLIVFRSNINICFVTNYMENGKQLIKTIFRYIDNLPEKLKPKIKKRTDTGFTLGSNVRFFVMSESKNIRKILSYLVIDDFDSFNKLKNNILPMLTKGITLDNINNHIIYLL